MLKRDFDENKNCINGFVKIMYPSSHETNLLIFENKIPTLFYYITYSIAIIIIDTSSVPLENSPKCIRVVSRVAVYVLVSYIFKSSEIPI